MTENQQPKERPPGDLLDELVRLSDTPRSDAQWKNHTLDHKSFSMQLERELGRALRHNEYMLEIAESNGFASLTEAITAGKKYISLPNAKSNDVRC